MKNHLELAHHYWKEHLQPGANVIDATVGNGHDIEFLSGLQLGQIYGYDIQEKAIVHAKQKFPKIIFFQKCHSDFSDITVPIHLVVYNLGYLPGSDKKITTKVETTLQSVHNALALVVPGGAVSITAYPGHDEGKREEEALLSALEKHDVCYHRWLNRPNSPTLFWIKKNK